MQSTKSIPYKTTLSLKTNSFVPHETLEHHCIATLNTPTPSLSCVATHNNLLYAGSTNEINVFDLSDYSLFDTLKTNDSTSGSVKSIAFNHTTIFTAHQDSKIRVWKITSSKRHRLVSVLPTIKDRLHRLVLPRNYVSVRRHTRRLWIEHWDAVSDLVVNNDLVYSVSWDKSFKIWNATDYTCLLSVKAHDDAINAVVVSGNGVVYTASADGLIRVWVRGETERTYCLVTTLEKHKSTVNALALNVDGSSLFSGSSDRSIIVWEIAESGVVFVEALWSHGGAILCLINVGDLLYSGSSDRTVRIWKRGSKSGFQALVVLEGHEKPVKSLLAVPGDVSNKNVLVCSAGLYGEIKIWKVYNRN